MKKSMADFRKILFKRERPNVRPFVLLENDRPTKDAGILWAAYQMGSFADIKSGMSQQEFFECLTQLQESMDKIYVIDDFSRVYKEGRGPVALACTNVNDLTVNAQGCAFKWATPKNVLRCVISFLQLTRHTKSTGVCFVKGTKESMPLMRHVGRYVHATYVGKVSKSEHLYSFVGRATHLDDNKTMKKAA